MPHGQVDIQVRALIGFVEKVEMWWQIGRPVSYQFKGVEGDWSNTQTIMLNPQTFLPPLVPLPNASYPLITKDPSISNQPDVDNSGLFGFALWVSVVVVVVVCVVVVLLVIIAVALWRKNVSQFSSSLNASVVVDG